MIADDKDLLKTLFKGELIRGALNFRFFLEILWYSCEVFDFQELIAHNQVEIFAVLINT
jgi:hypothetical protein